MTSVVFPSTLTKFRKKELVVQSRHDAAEEKNE